MKQNGRISYFFIHFGYVPTTTSSHSRRLLGTPLSTEKPSMLNSEKSNTLLRLGAICIVLCNRLLRVIEFIWSRTSGLQVKSITTMELNRRLLESPDAILFIDVRSRRERDISTIPGAMGLEEFQDYLASPDASDHTSLPMAIPFCAIGGRSYFVTRQLLRHGVNAMNYQSGIIGWTRAELPLVSPDGTPTNRVHRYWPIFAVPDSYEALTS